MGELRSSERRPLSADSGKGAKSIFKLGSTAAADWHAHTNKAGGVFNLASYGGLQRAPGQISGKIRQCVLNAFCEYEDAVFNAKFLVFNLNSKR